MNAISPSNTAVVYEVELATTQRGDADLPEASSPSGHCRVLRDLSLLCSPHRCHGDPRAEAELLFVHLPTAIPGDADPVPAPALKPPPSTTSPSSHTVISLFRAS